MGSEVGPDLMDAVRRPKKFFLAKILDPNLNISPGYETYVIETRSGATVTGVIARESPTSVTLRREEGEEETLLRSNIAALRVSASPPCPRDWRMNRSRRHGRPAGISPAVEHAGSDVTDS